MQLVFLSVGPSLNFVVVSIPRERAVVAYLAEALAAEAGAFVTETSQRTALLGESIPMITIADVPVHLTGSCTLPDM